MRLNRVLGASLDLWACLGLALMCWYFVDSGILYMHPEFYIVHLPAMGLAFAGVVEAWQEKT